MPAHEPVARGDEYLPPSEKRQVTGELGTFKAIAISAVIVLTQFVQPSTLNHGLRADFIYMIPFGAGVNGALAIGEDLGVPPNKATWTVAAYPYVSIIMIFDAGGVCPHGWSRGRLYGHKNVVLAAGIWWVIFQPVSGFVRNFIALCVIRALTGIGGAFMVPNAIALLTIAFPPGRQRNITVGLFGAMAPIGAAGGSVFPGIFPRDKGGGRIDYLGVYLGVAGLILFNFAWKGYPVSQEPIVGSDEPYVYVLLIVSILHFAAFVVWEWRVANEPILPLDIWPAPSFSIMIVVAFAFFSFMSVGIVIWYISIRNLTIRHYTLFLNGAGYATLAVCGTVAAIASAKVIRYLPAQYIMAIGSVASCVALTLTATMPEQQTYWVQIFPALIFTARQQGVAASLIGTILSYGLSTGLGFSGTVEVYTNNDGKDPVRRIRHALYVSAWPDVQWLWR
ncbi:major facilitator superfamily domain-containing protein [Lipomyces tetrasporus]|uniref:Major facilitator superfamily domain-containing protein n=1 Tax=Lipomyces tetrasporus TaxID=54092 RepID=A0AAD7QSG9_9ASCO|nr:major facilitator superfamily domain-containing protein [Lipomyces tetrasporus]KAJ8100131.1 major facilitator superfamily domain-containing protein [Lipomyces tetrasporus]